MPDDPKKALVMVLGKPKGDAGESSSYDDDLKVALDDLASALGVKVKDADKGIEALKTIHDLCARAAEEGDEGSDEPDMMEG